MCLFFVFLVIFKPKGFHRDESPSKNPPKTNHSGITVEL